MAKHIRWQFTFLIWSTVLVSRAAFQSISVVAENESDVFLFTEKFQLPGPTCNVTRVKDTLNEGVVIRWTQPERGEDGQYSVNVTLAEPLDFEYIMEKNGKNTLNVQLTVTFVCASGEQERPLLRWTIFVSDVQDSIPEFQLDRYENTIPENQPIDTIILYNITAIDKDSSDQVDYVIETSANDRGVFKGVIEVKNVEGKDRHVLDIRLAKPIDYEKATRYSLTVTAKDTANSSSTCDVIIRVKDIQDTPPSFSLPVYSGRVDEMAPKGTSVAMVSALDGDGPSVRNLVVYSIVEGLTDVFEVDSSTGVISTKGQLDIDGNSSIGTNGLVILTVQAEENNSSGEVQYGNTTDRALVQIQIDDANDHPPLFGSPTYSGSIRGGAVAGEIVSIDGGGYISVTDQDLAPSNNHFKLHIERDGKPWSVFGTNIESQFVQASVLIVLKEPAALGNLQNTHLKFQVVASDYSRTSKTNTTSSVAEIIVFVLPRVTSAPPPQPIVDLPISESDVIVFVMGFLLLLNIILTLIICRLMCRNNGSGGGLGLFRRNSKYYVSGRKGIDDNGGVERVASNDNNNQNNGISNVSGDNSESQSQNQTATTTIVPPLLSAKESNKASVLTDVAINRNTNLRNTVTSAADRNRCDVTRLNEAETGTVNQQMGLGIDKNEGIEKGSNSASIAHSDRCDVTPLTLENQRESSNFKTGPSTSSNKCDLIPMETTISSTSRALSSLLDRVHQKLSPGNKSGKSEACDLRPLKDDNSSLDSSLNTSNNSSFSDKTKYGVTPFTGDNSPDTTKDASSTPPVSPSHVNLAYVSDETDTNTLKPSKRGHQIPSDNVHQPTTPGAIKIPQQNQAQQQQRKPAASSTFIPTLSPSQTQITQTGVPPVALALPLGNNTTQKLIDDKRTNAATVNNPVYNEGGKGGRTTTIRDFSVPQPPPQLMSRSVKTTDLNQIVTINNSQPEKGKDSEVKGVTGKEPINGKGILRKSPPPPPPPTTTTNTVSNSQPSEPKQVSVDYVAAAKLLLERSNSLTRDAKDKI